MPCSPSGAHTCLRTRRYLDVGVCLRGAPPGPVTFAAFIRPSTSSTSNSTSSPYLRARIARQSRFAARPEKNDFPKFSSGTPSPRRFESRRFVSHLPTAPETIHRERALMHEDVFRAITGCDVPEPTRTIEPFHLRLPRASASSSSVIRSDRPHRELGASRTGRASSIDPSLGHRRRKNPPSIERDGVPRPRRVAHRARPNARARALVARARASSPIHVRCVRPRASPANSGVAARRT